MRRIFLLMAAFTLSACAGGVPEPERYPTLSGDPPLIIAHRGASGDLPEHTIEAYTLAIEQGADFIEPDLVMTRDGVLIARHDRYLSTTTNVADLSEFADRKRLVDTPSGSRNDWWAEDFTLDEIKSLRARQPFEGRSKAYDDQFEIPTFEQVVALANENGVGIYPETKSPSHHAAIGLDMKTPLLEAMTAFAGPAFIQSFEAGILRELDELTDWNLVQLISGDPRAAMAGHEPLLEDVAAYADGVGPNKILLWTSPGEPSGFLAEAHALGLAVHPWTFRNDNLPPSFETPEAEFEAYWALGVDGVFTDFPGTAVPLRDEN